MFAELVLTGNAVFTGDGSAPFKGGVAIAEGKILACGDELHLAPFIGPATELRDCGDGLIMPGLIDSHTHLAQGSMTTDADFCVNLIDCTSLAQCMKRVAAFAESHPNNEWILGVQVVQFQWDVPEMPSAKMIDEYIADRPVLLQQVDLHTYSANTCALKKAGITRDTPDPTGGKILRDEGGEPTGVFSNNGAQRLLGLVYDPPLERAKQSFAKTVRYANSLGITSVGSVHPTFVGLENPYEVFADMSREGKFPLRVFVYTDLFDLETMVPDEIRSRYSFPGTTIEWRGFKQFLDGVCSDHSAWMLAPYANAPKLAGEPSEDPERLRRGVLRACELGCAVRVHAIGDRAVRSVLDYFEEAEKLFGNKGLRHCMEHNETVQPEDLPRYARLGVSPAMQPRHMLLDMVDLAKDDAVGPERAALSWPLHSMVASGANVHLGSDFPVVGIEPMVEVYGAVYRMLEDGSNPEGWYPAERITVAEALKAYTHGSAYAMGVDDRVGTLTPGKLADVCVLDRNIFACGPAELLRANAVLTVLGGKIVHEA